MTRTLSRRLAAGTAVFALAVAAAVANGCGGIDCTETETCPGVADASPDQHVVDVTIAPDAGDASVEPEAQPGDETIVVGPEPVDMGDAEADAFDATLDVESDATEEPEVADAELDARADVVADAKTGALDAADGSDGCVNRGGPENCTNGKDDNCDGLIDCADPLCVPDAGGFLGYTCEPIPPAGWIAPVILYDTTVPTTSPAATPIGCTANYGARVFVGHDVPNPGSSACNCTCGLANNAQCTNPTVTFYSTPNNGCTGSTLGTTQVQTACTGALPSGQGGINGIRVTDAGFPSSSGCEAGVSPSISPFDNTNDWLRTGSGCTTSREQAGAPLYQGGCAPNQVCMENPALSAGTGTHFCAVFEGAQVCGGAYNVPFNYYDGGVDNRSCSASGCSCGSPPLSCTPNVTVGQGNCTTNVRNETSTSCDPVTNYNAPVVAMGSASCVAGSCPASGNGTLNGGVTHNTAGVTTVCCTQ